MGGRRSIGFRVAMGMVFLLVWGPSAWGWGPVAHRTIGAIADANLSPQAKWATSRWLRGASLAEVANWADAVRNTAEYAHTSGYHFEEVSDGETYLESLRTKTPRQLQRGGLVAGLMVAHLMLRDPRTSARGQEDALKFLVHLVGDVHQPLHTGRPEDRGGSIIDLTWHGRRSNLHRVWDSGLIMEGHRDILREGMTARATSDAYARYLLEKYAQEPTTLRMNVGEWLEESLLLRVAAYGELVAPESPDYVSFNIESVDRRVYVAGMRLARMVNDIAERRGVPADEGELWRQMAEIMGDPRETIHLGPRFRK